MSVIKQGQQCDKCHSKEEGVEESLTLSEWKGVKTTGSCGCSTIRKHHTGDFGEFFFCNFKFIVLVCVWLVCINKKKLIFISCGFISLKKKKTLVYYPFDFQALWDYSLSFVQLFCPAASLWLYKLIGPQLIVAHEFKLQNQTCLRWWTELLCHNGHLHSDTMIMTDIMPFFLDGK